MAVARCLALVGSCMVLAGCGPKYPRLPTDKAALIGMTEDREAQEQESWVRGTIRRLDGRTVKLRREEHVEPGCHLLEVEVEYKIARPNDSPCLAFKTFGACGAMTKFESGRRHFAIPMRPGKRYELSARVTEQGAWVYFVEVDAELGTVARFIPVYPGTTTCSPGIAL